MLLLATQWKVEVISLERGPSSLTLFSRVDDSEGNAYGYYLK